MLVTGHSASCAPGHEAHLAAQLATSVFYVAGCVEIAHCCLVKLLIIYDLWYYCSRPSIFEVVDRLHELVDPSLAVRHSEGANSIVSAEPHNEVVSFISGLYAVKLVAYEDHFFYVARNSRNCCL